MCKMFYVKLMEIKMQKHIVDSQKIKQRKSEHATMENH